MPGTRSKPTRWNVNRGMVAPEWLWAWDKLVDVVLFDEAGGNPRTLLQGLELVRSGTTWEVGSAGRGLQSDASNERVNATSLSSHRIGFPITIAAFFRQLGVTPAHDNHLGVSHNNSDSGPFWSYGIGGLSDAVKLQWNSGGSAASFSSGTTDWVDFTGQDVLAVGILADGDQRLILNGFQEGSQSNSLSDPTYGSTSQLELGAQTGTTGRFSNSLMYVAYIWNRVLSANECAILQVDPFGPVRPAMSLFGRAPVAAATAALSGTITATIDEADIVASGKILDWTLTGDTWKLEI